jgi:hypothetical protein
MPSCWGSNRWQGANAFQAFHKIGFNLPWRVTAPLAVITPFIHRIVDKNSTTRYGNHIICLFARFAVNPAVSVVLCDDSTIDLHRLIGAGPMFA